LKTDYSETHEQKYTYTQSNNSGSQQMNSDLQMDQGVFSPREQINNMEYEDDIYGEV